MRRMFYVYILASDSRDLFVGITNNLVGRMIEHRHGHDAYRRVFRHGARTWFMWRPRAPRGTRCCARSS